MILIATLAPPIWHWPGHAAGIRKLVVVAGGLGLVGCCTHAITAEILRVFSLTGAHPTQLSPQFWLPVERHKADLRDIRLTNPGSSSRAVSGACSHWLPRQGTAAGGGYGPH